MHSTVRSKSKKRCIHCVCIRSMLNTQTKPCKHKNFLRAKRYLPGQIVYIIITGWALYARIYILAFIYVTQKSEPSHV